MEARPPAHQAVIEAQESVVADEAELRRLPPAALEAAQQLALRRSGRLHVSQRQHSPHLSSEHLTRELEFEQNSTSKAECLNTIHQYAAGHSKPGRTHAHADGRIADPLQLVLAAEACALSPQLCGSLLGDAHGASTESITGGKSPVSDQQQPYSLDQRQPHLPPAAEYQPASAVLEGLGEASWQYPAAAVQSAQPDVAWQAPPGSPMCGEVSEADEDESSQWSDTASETSSSSVWSEFSADGIQHGSHPILVRTSWASARREAHARASPRQATSSSASMPLPWADRLRDERHTARADPPASTVKENLAPDSRDRFAGEVASDRPSLQALLTLANVPSVCSVTETDLPAAGSTEQSSGTDAQKARELFPHASLPLTRASLLRVRHPEDESPGKGTRRQASPGSLRVEALSECGLSSEDEDDRRASLAPLGLLSTTLSPVIGALLSPRAALGIPAHSTALLPPPTAASVMADEGADNRRISAARVSTSLLQSEGVPSQASEHLPPVSALQHADVLGGCVEPRPHVRCSLQVVGAHRQQHRFSLSPGAVGLPEPDDTVAMEAVGRGRDAPPAQHRLSGRPRDLKEAANLFHLRTLATRCLKVTRKRSFRLAMIAMHPILAEHICRVQFAPEAGRRTPTAQLALTSSPCAAFCRR